ncbi:Hypothetical predicted protein [Mytilus galloprovincialis]|uniref:Uncharacterized protein n=1 Tax=Mytilus galloprovincialis TaxID=29158 RepID=A0A8B6FJG0_MYTGA|nr:Hypothetical predicted protein [Mytilus galloprovincialis]
MELNRQFFRVEKGSLIEYNYFHNFTNPWIEAAAEGYTDLLQFLLDLEWNQGNNYISINTLYAACRKGNVDIVKLLLNYYTNMHNTCSYVLANNASVGLVLLLVTCIEGHTAIVKILLESIADLSLCIKRCEQSCLHNANEEGFTDLDNLFYLCQGIDFSQFCVHGKSPIYMACYKGRFDILQILLNYGADTSILCDSLLFGKACMDGYPSILEFLIWNNNTAISLEANTLLVEACIRGHTDIVAVLLDDYPQGFQCDFNYKLPLCIACHCGHADIVRVLLKYCVEIVSEIKYDEVEKMLSEYNYYAESFGFSPLSIISNIEQRNKLSCGCIYDFYSKYAKLPLQLACYFGHVKTIKVLLENKFDVNQCNSYGESSMYTACVKGHTNVVELLLGANADLFRCNKFGKSPLFVACENGHTNTVKLLLEHNADISSCGRSKKSPFLVACEKGHADIVLLLLHTKRDVFQCDRYGRSPLYVACREGHVEIVNILLSNKAVTFDHNKYGKSLHRVALENRHLDIVDILSKNTMVFI